MAIGCGSADKKTAFQNRERDGLLKLALQIQKDLDDGRKLGAKIKLEILIAQIKITVSQKYVPTNSYNISGSTALGVVQSTINSLGKYTACPRYNLYGNLRFHF